MKLSTNLIFLFPAMMTSMASAALIVDFTTAGPDGTVFDASVPANFVFSSEETTAVTTGVTFDITVTAVIPTGGGAFGGDVARVNGGLGSTVENSGVFVNVITDVSEVLRFTVSNVLGLPAGQSIQIGALLSQNSRSQTANQSGGYGGTFGQVAADSVTLTPDVGSSIVINQSDAGDLGAILLNGNGNNNTNTGNTYEHLGTLDFTSSFDVAITGTVNNAIVIQGFEFVVVPEPSTSFMALGGLGLLLRRRR